MSGEQREKCLQVLLSKAERLAIDDYRFAMRLPSRSAALRELMRIGMVASDYEDRKHSGN